jgi:alkanesulfonate monooxygenase SsuD/methylene tetrahydromethanopterin reductase-like flavin-dependent oxidoreductase (luciferase family)
MHASHSASSAPPLARVVATLVAPRRLSYSSARSRSAFSSDPEANHARIYRPHQQPRRVSDIVASSGPIIDKAYIRNHVQAAEAAGIDRLLIGQFAQWPDNNQIAAYVFSQTERIGALLAHRPGLMQPTLGARQLATLDQFSEGRVWAHIITGGSDADQARDGDFEEPRRALCPHRRIYRGAAQGLGER